MLGTLLKSVLRDRGSTLLRLLLELVLLIRLLLVCRRYRRLCPFTVRVAVRRKGRYLGHFLLLLQKLFDELVESFLCDSSSHVLAQTRSALAHCIKLPEQLLKVTGQLLLNLVRELRTE